MKLEAFLGAAGLEQPLPRNAAELFESDAVRDLTEPLSGLRPALRAVEVEALVELVIIRHRWLDSLTRSKGLSDEQLEAVGPAPRRDRLTAVKALSTDPDVANRAALLAFDGELIEASLVSGSVRATGSALEGEYKLAEIASETWLNLARSEKDGAAKLAWELPYEATLEASAHRQTLEGLIGKKKVAAALRELLAGAESRLADRLTALHEEAVLRIVAAEYRALLEVAPLKVQPLGAVYVGTDKQRVGLALLDKRGAIAATAPLRPTGDWTDRVVRWMRDQKARLVVIPTTAPAGEWLNDLDTYCNDQKLRTVRVSPAGLVEARTIDDPVLKRVSPEEASAVVLLRRASKPLDEWCRVDPGRIGLSRVQGELEPIRLLELLQVIRERVIASVQPLSNAPVVTGGIRARATAPLNPDISSIRDLRPGLQVKGLITNVTKFGAFVNLGIKQEGLVHISELADEFVPEPSDVVQAGQQVTARVITVDADRGRIALSLRSEAAAARGPTRGPPRMGRDPLASRPPPRRAMSMSARPTGPGPRMDDMSAFGGPSGASDPQDRAKALRDLENLFKKPAS